MFPSIFEFEADVSGTVHPSHEEMISLQPMFPIIFPPDFPDCLDGVDAPNVETRFLLIKCRQY